MAMVVTVAFSGLRIAVNAWERGGRAVDDLQRRALVERLIQRQLALASPTQFTIKDERGPMFRGSAQRIEFVADYSLVDGSHSDFRKVDYGADTGRFLYSEKPLFEYEPKADEDLPKEVIATFHRISFQFLGNDDRGNPMWRDEWKFGMGLPTAIQVHIDDDTFVVRLVNR